MSNNQKHNTEYNSVSKLNAPNKQNFKKSNSNTKHITHYQLQQHFYANYEH